MGTSGGGNGPIFEATDLQGRRPSMFETTLQAQGLGEGQQKIGALSVAVLAHVGLGLAIVAGTALIVPPFRPPEPPPRPFAIVSLPALETFTERPIVDSRPKKGNDAAKPAKNVVPPPVAHDVPPVTTPDPPPETADQPPTDLADGPGEGTPGVKDGSLTGTVGGTGEGEGGPGFEHGVDPVEVTGDMVRPVLLAKVEPSYPQVARRAGLRGRVILRAVIAENGNVESVEVLSVTNPIFSDAAVDAVRQWRYRPASMGGRPVRVYLSVVVEFLVR
jgi:protein TonB